MTTAFFLSAIWVGCIHHLTTLISLEGKILSPIMNTWKLQLPFLPHYKYRLKSYIGQTLLNFTRPRFSLTGYFGSSIICLDNCYNEICKGQAWKSTVKSKVSYCLKFTFHEYSHREGWSAETCRENEQNRPANIIKSKLSLEIKFPCKEGSFF